MHKLSGSSRINDALAKYDILTFKDVIFHLPRRYLDLTYSDEFRLNSNDKVTLLLKASSAPLLIKRGNLSIIKFKALSNLNTEYNIIAFNQKYIVSSVKPGTFFTVHGTINLRRREITVTKLFMRSLSDHEFIVPLYSLPSEVANHEFIKIVKKGLLNTEVKTLVPPSFAVKNDLVSPLNALKLVHNPFVITDVFKGLKSLKYEEGLRHFIKLFDIKRQNSELYNDQKTLVDLKAANEFVKALPYKLTSEQIKAVREIGFDMNKRTLMYRLLQGDVGSGKTVVSFVALYINYLRGAQGVLLAPTESLARQHYASLLALFKPFKLRIRLLIGALSESDKKALKREIQDGEVDLIVGTHALFSEDTTYPRLELVVIDELQKFGVNQRNALREKGEKADLLLLSATPIPQTLANVLYGDMDITTLEAFPHAGREVETIVRTSTDKEIGQLIAKSLQEERQVYVIAPTISFNEKANVLSLYAKYQKKYGPIVGILHGAMKSDEKDLALQNFAAGITKILIATSVVEVGIDVKNAGLMLIYEPNHFGLSSLHQLRGRIGRDGKKATLALLSDDEDNEKLLAFASENDGFKIAELDLSLRGPGELTGERQSGMPSFLYLNVIKDLPLISQIKKDAEYAMAHANEPEFRVLISEVLTEE